MTSEKKLILLDTIRLSFLLFVLALASLYLSGMFHIIPGLWLANIIGIVLLQRHSQQNWSIPILGMTLAMYMAFTIFGHPLLSSACLTVIYLIEIVIIACMFKHYHSDELFRSAIENSGIGMALISKDGSLFMVNSTFCKMLDFTADELKKLKVQDITDPDDLPSTLERLKNLNSGKISELSIEKRYMRKSGKTVWINLQITAIPKKNGVPKYYFARIEDITQLKSMRDEFLYNSEHDVLTGLLNRRKFETLLNLAVQNYQTKGTRYIVCYLDLDWFKTVNDLAGHAAGDRLLQEVAKCLQLHLRKFDALARLGGDEFGILLFGGSVSDGKQICENLIEVVNAIRFHWEGKTYHIGLSIGMEVLSDRSLSATQLLSDTDLACYAAKAEGRNQIYIFDREKNESGGFHQDMVLVNDIQNAVDQNRFIFYMQKIVGVNSTEPYSHHYEILIRLISDDNKLMDANNFVMLAERFNLMGRVDRWVLSQILAHYDKQLNALDAGYFSINISANSLNDPYFLSFLIALIKQSALAPERLCFEITETAAMRHISKTIPIINTLKEMGCKIALDDFGVGLSSFNYIKNFSVNIIKIDGAFVKNVATQKVDKMIVETIHAMAHRLGMKTVAEYVENEEILKVITELGVDYAQGYMMGMPEPLTNLFVADK